MSLLFRETTHSSDTALALVQKAMHQIGIHEGKIGENITEFRKCADEIWSKEVRYGQCTKSSLISSNALPERGMGVGLKPVLVVRSS